MSDIPIKVLLVDDHRIMREGLRLLVQQQPDMQVAGEADDAGHALVCFAQSMPDVAVIDIHPPGQNSLEAAQRILAASASARIVILAGQPDPEAADQALELGVLGYILKENASDELIQAIRAAMAGRLYLCTKMTSALLRARHRDPDAVPPVPEPSLSERENLLLRLVAEGQRNKEIATELRVSTKSVETYRSRLMKKLGCRSTAELVRYAIRQHIAMP